MLLGVTRKEQCIGPSGSNLVFSGQRIAVKGRRARWPSGSRKGVADAAVLGVASGVNCWWPPFGASSTSLGVPVEPPLRVTEGTLLKMLRSDYCGPEL
jgi:hypothetical protein